MIPLPLITHAVAAMAAAAAAWTWQANAHDAEISKLKVAQAKAMFRALETAHGQTIAMQEKKDAAIRKAEKRAAILARDVAVGRDSIQRLSDAASSAISAANDSHSACQAVVSTSTELLKQCSVRYSHVAEEADRWVNEALMLRESWPRKQ